VVGADDYDCDIGTLFRASQFLSEELPIRLAHRVQELEHLPDGLNEMPSIERVRDWYAQSFEVRIFHHS
jgi:pyruvate dehydrogenase kinase 2/3/4